MGMAGVALAGLKGRWGKALPRAEAHEKNGMYMGRYRKRK